MKLLDFVKNHLVATVAIACGAVALVVAGSSFISYSSQYAAEAEQMSKDREALNAKLPKLPKQILHDNDYVSYDDSSKTVTGSKSAYKNYFVYEAQDAEISLNDEKTPATYKAVEGTAWDVITDLYKKGGTIKYNINTSNYGMSDIDIVMASCWHDKAGTLQEITNVSDWIKIEINGLLVRTEDFTLKDDGSFEHLILKDTHLMEGANTLAIKTAVNNTVTGSTDLYVMPDIRNIAVITNCQMAAE